MQAVAVAVVITVNPEPLVVLAAAAQVVRMATQFMQIPALQTLAVVAEAEAAVSPVLDLAQQVALA
jgi:hypothetical protein